MTTPGSPPTMAPADLLIGLLERVPMSEAQIARATQAEPETIQAWLRRREAPAGLEAQRLTELVAFVEEMARTFALPPSSSGSIATSTSFRARIPSTSSPAAVTSG